MFRSTILRVAGIALVGIGVAGACLAIPTTPEIDPSTGANALALIAGAFMIMRSRRK